MVNILSGQGSGEQNNYECELCGLRFYTFGPAEKHERWECEVGHEVRTAFSKGEIESPRSGKMKREREERRKKKRASELKKLSEGTINEFSTLKGEIDKAKKSVSSGLLDDISEERSPVYAQTQ